MLDAEAPEKEAARKRAAETVAGDKCQQSIAVTNCPFISTVEQAYEFSILFHH